MSEIKTGEAVKPFEGKSVGRAAWRAIKDVGFDALNEAANRLRLTPLTRGGRKMTLSWRLNDVGSGSVFVSQPQKELLPGRRETSLSLSRNFHIDRGEVVGVTHLYSEKRANLKTEDLEAILAKLGRSLMGGRGNEVIKANLEEERAIAQCGRLEPKIEVDELVKKLKSLSESQRGK